MEKKTPTEKLHELAEKASLKLGDLKFAQFLDEQDSFKEFQDLFLIPQKKNFTNDGQQGNSIYLCGNSLGLQPKSARQKIEEELNEWERVGVEGHFNHSKNRPWLTTDENLEQNLANCVGAQKDEVVAMNSLTTNLHLMMVSFQYLLC
jgi:kynureninase